MHKHSTHTHTPCSSSLPTYQPAPRSNSPSVRESDSRDRRRERHKEDSSSRKGKHKAGKESLAKRQDRSWLFPNTRVRIIDQTYKRGKHYNEKVSQRLEALLWSALLLYLPEGSGLGSAFAWSSVSTDSLRLSLCWRAAAL